MRSRQVRKRPGRPPHLSGGTNTRVTTASYLECMARLMESGELGMQPSLELLTEYETLYKLAVHGPQPVVEEPS